MNWEPLGFMFFSTIETISLYCLIMALFRYKSSTYFWEAMVMVLLNNVQSYLMRHDLSLEFLVPLLTIFIFVVFFAVVVKIPLVWSIIATCLGFVIFAFIQTGLLLTLIGSISKVQRDLSAGWLLQFSTGVIIIMMSNLLYKLGLGFKFDFEKLRYRFEDILIIFLIGSFLILVSFLFYYKKLMLNGLLFTMTMGFLLYYAVRRERE
ncbi:hypothetical protein ACE6ED_25460 [Paenibacillus sp. CN-4]|uniref:hypothetical protein n=1 Tax=Paenibacillus nanchangensis TaxID=3348343 RepID=UPI00397DD802